MIPSATSPTRAVDEDRNSFPTTTVVVVNCNGANELARCLDALAAAEPSPDEIILVDNGSTDDSLKIARSRKAKLRELRIIELPENLGLSIARNVGVEAAHGDVVAFVDNDAAVRPDWLARGVETMERFDAQAIQCKLLLKDSPGSLDSVGYLLGPFGFPRQLARPGTPDGPEFSIPTRLFGAKGAGMMFRRDLLNSIGGFDPSFFYGGDESELFWRIFRAQGEVVLAPESIIVHAAGGTRRFLSEMAEDLLYRGGTRNYIRMVAKNQHPSRVVLDVSGQVATWIAVAVFQLFRGKARIAVLVLRGVAEAVGQIPAIFSARRRDALAFRRVPKHLRARMTLSYIRETARAI